MFRYVALTCCDCLAQLLSLRSALRPKKTLKECLGRVRLGSIRNENNWNNVSKRLLGSYSHSGVPGFPFRLFCSQEGPYVWVIDQVRGQDGSILASFFCACLWTSTSSRSINTQKKNLANIQPSWPRTWSITHTYGPLKFTALFTQMSRDFLASLSWQIKAKTFAFFELRLQCNNFNWLAPFA